MPKKIILSWDSNVGEDFAHYRIYRTSSKILPYTLVDKTTSNSYEDLINSNGVQRYYKVTVMDKDQLESLKQKEPTAGQTLSSPSTPAFTSISFDGTAINLSWNVVDRAVSYTLYREGGGVEKIISDIAQTNYSDAAIQVGVTYNYRVISVDEFGLGSDKSDKVEINTK
ncbi:fibronectin type III domain-containing protein [Campylobacter sp. 7477a]|uniref:fibronectin type III domain-containing protein n=1 Tax=Campylobacter sp. 7477a TaxID=2735741 RepID=UPI00301439E8